MTSKPIFKFITGVCLLLSLPTGGWSETSEARSIEAQGERENLFPSAPFEVKRAQCVSYSLKGQEAQVIHSAIAMFAEDLNDVLGSRLKQVTQRKASIVIENENRGEPQSFSISIRRGKLFVVGADSLGTAYGIMELSRMLGVSPWKWWADSRPQQKEVWRVPATFADKQSPAVLYRGIFINDEDQGLMPWSWKTFDPSQELGRIGPKTHEKIFQLLLRLRANVFWPAMHSNSSPFFTVKGNREMAEKYGVIIGTSHCEPMLRNTNGEWKKWGVGEYNYVTNRENVLNFWRERVLETRHSNGFYTLGMRGIHDTGMVGVEGLANQKRCLEKVIEDQRNLLRSYVNEDLTAIKQVFIPYKEVLPIYNAGMQIADEVTLMWCDDNYGYIRHQPTDEERQRKGGNGVYYHFSYWGRPKSHVWLPSTAPALVHEELQRAYDNGIQRLWVFNVGDIKPNEFLMEYGLDMAWDTQVLHDNDVNHYQKKWIEREFGKEHVNEINEVFNLYYELGYRRRAEMLGHTRQEDTPDWKEVSDLPWTDQEVQAHLKKSMLLAAKVDELGSQVTDSVKWFELVGYPAKSYAAMAEKMLVGQLARHGKSGWSRSEEGHQKIFSLTNQYHQLLNGKWNEMMGVWAGQAIYRSLDSCQSCAPVDSTITELPVTDGKWEAPSSYLIPQLGYLGEALSLAKNDTFTIRLPQGKKKAVLCFVPVHPGSEGRLAVEVTTPDREKHVVTYQTVGRSEEWKENIENNQARRVFSFPPVDSLSGTFKVKALTSGIIIDEIIL